MEQGPSWEANQSLQLDKKFPTFLWNPKVLYRTHKCPPTVPILSRLYPVPTPHSNLLKIHLNIIHPSTSGSPQWPLSLWLPHQQPVRTSLLSHTCHMPRPSQSRTVHDVVLYRSATPDLQIRIHQRWNIIDVERIAMQLLILRVALLQQKLLLETDFIEMYWLLLWLHC
jgi:hypothetical protein